MAYYGQQQPQRFQPRANNGYRVQQQPAPPQYGHPQPVRPHQLKRQASELKSMYPLTKWCAVYINTKGSNPSNEWDEVDITSKIPETNVYLPMDLEENITMEVQMQIDEEKELKNKLSRQKQEIEASKQKKASAENDKIDTFMTFTSITDRNRARQLLESNDWDLQKAAAQQFSSSPDVMRNNGNIGGGEGPKKQSANNGKAVIRMILPDNRQYTYQMDGNDTFWGVYGRLLQSVPELASKAFNLELSNGSTLNENEFDQTLFAAQLVPRGDIRIKY